MNTENIGTWAGLVWNALNDAQKPLNLKDLRKASKLKVNEMNCALGWLAKEGKLNFDESKDDMKLLALFCKAVRYKFDICLRHFDDTDEDDIISGMKTDNTLTAMGITGDDIEEFVYTYFDVENYIPHNADCEPHDYSLKLSLVPEDYKNPLEDKASENKFLLAPWNNAQ